jgi:hypothetical protein
VSDGPPHPLIGPDDPLTVIGRELIERAAKLPPLGGDAVEPVETHYHPSQSYDEFVAQTFAADNQRIVLVESVETAVSLGRKGGQSRASHLSPVERSESARKAAKARWGKADA